MNKIIAVDFDGTLCTHSFPCLGLPIKPIIDYILKEKAKGSKIILWTCRNGSLLQEAVEWSREQGIEFDAVNDDIPELKLVEFGKVKSCKVYADEYLDDKAREIFEFLKQ